MIGEGEEVKKYYRKKLSEMKWADGNSNEVPPAEALKTIGLLIERGDRLDLKDNRGKTARMIAADMGHEAVLKVLTKAGGG